MVVGLKIEMWPVQNRPASPLGIPSSGSLLHQRPFLIVQCWCSVGSKRIPALVNVWE